MAGNIKVFVGPVEPGIPIPPQARIMSDGHAPYPFAQMWVGDSFLTDSPSIAMVAKTWAKARGLNWSFSVRYQGEGRTRIWRTK